MGEKTTAVTQAKALVQNNIFSILVNHFWQEDLNMIVIKTKQ